MSKLLCECCLRRTIDSRQVHGSCRYASSRLRCHAVAFAPARCLGLSDTVCPSDMMMESAIDPVDSMHASGRPTSITQVVRAHHTRARRVPSARRSHGRSGLRRVPGGAAHGPHLRAARARPRGAGAGGEVS